MRKKLPWKHKTRKSDYLGFYRKDENGDRRFDLIPVTKGLKNVSFESPSAAKKAGWAHG